MKCHNYLCVHNFGKECELEEITIDWRGNCENLQYIYIPEKSLRANKLYTQIFIDNRLRFHEKTGTYTHIKK